MTAMLACRKPLVDTRDRRASRGRPGHPVTRRPRMSVRLGCSIPRLAALAAAAVLVLTACGAGPAPSPAQQAPAASAAGVSSAAGASSAANLTVCRHYRAGQQEVMLAPVHALGALIVRSSLTRPDSCLSD